MVRLARLVVAIALLSSFSLYAAATRAESNNQYGHQTSVIVRRDVDYREEDNVYSTAVVGGQHGTPVSPRRFIWLRRESSPIKFTDLEMVQGYTHRRISYMTLAGCGLGEHVSAIKLGFRDNHSKDPMATKYPATVVHGQYFGDAPQETLYLDKNEYITEMQLTTWQKKVGGGLFSTMHTRVGWIKVWTSGGQHFQCGSYANTDPSYDFIKPKYALLYLSGAQGDALDNLQGHFIPAQDF